MASASPRFHSGDEVVLRPPSEILATLDDAGTLDGLPFMPEMTELWGRTFRVARRLEKTCVEGYLPRMRRFHREDVVALESVRCDGDHHDGCRRGCVIFWKEAWLCPAAEGVTDPPPAAEIEALRARLRVKRDASHYFCQSTELMSATEAFPGKVKPWMVRIAFREWRNGDRSVGEVLGLLLRWIPRRLTKKRTDRMMRGPLKRTPTASLNLRPGERVRIKSREEILPTLDAKGRNRGLTITYPMSLLCGTEHVVTGTVDRMIDERTGKMLEVTNTVTLRGVQCLCHHMLGSCPRGDLLYWREIWLERTAAESTPDC